MTWLVDLLRALWRLLFGHPDQPDESDYVFISRGEYLTDGANPLKWRR